MNMLKKYLLSAIPFQMPDSGGSSGSSTPTAPSSPSGGSESSATSSSAAPAPSPSTASPAPSPSGPSSAEPSSSPRSEEVVDFSMIFGDGPEPTVAQPSTPPAAPSAPQAPQAPQQPAPASAAQPAQAQPQAQVQPQEPGQASPAPTEAAPTATAPQLDPYDPGSLVQALTQNEAQAIQHVADNVFKLSAEEVEALESDTVGTVPKLLAKALVRSQQNMLQTLARLIPTMIQRQTSVMKRRMESEQAFYSRWPDLKQDQHGDLVNRYAQVYRQMNPEVSTKDMIEAVGAMVMTAAKITPSAPGAAPQAQVPVSPMASRGVQPSPFAPAAAMAGGPTASTPVEQSVMEAMFDPNNG